MDKCLILMCVHESLLLLSTGATVVFFSFLFSLKEHFHILTCIKFLGLPRVSFPYVDIFVVYVVNNGLN